MAQERVWRRVRISDIYPGYAGAMGVVLQTALTSKMIDISEACSNPSVHIHFYNFSSWYGYAKPHASEVCIEAAKPMKSR